MFCLFVRFSSDVSSYMADGRSWVSAACSVLGSPPRLPLCWRSALTNLVLVWTLLQLALEECHGWIKGCVLLTSQAVRALGLIGWTDIVIPVLGKTLGNGCMWVLWEVPPHLRINCRPEWTLKDNAAEHSGPKITPGQYLCLSLKTATPARSKGWKEQVWYSSSFTL